MLVYLHGFNSGPQSVKAALLQAALARRTSPQALVAPRLPHRPTEAVAGIEKLLREAVVGAAADEPLCLVGSSLGGYYAMWLGERHPQARIVLLNPAVRPYELLSDYLGPQRNPYTGEEYTLTGEHMDELLTLRVERLTAPERYFAIVETGDEVLDYRQIGELLPTGRLQVVTGGDHAMSDFAAHVDAVLDFCSV